MTSELSTFAARVRAFIAASTPVTASERSRNANSELGTRNSELKHEPRFHESERRAPPRPAGIQTQKLAEAVLGAPSGYRGTVRGFSPAGESLRGGYDREFQALALELFALQFAHNAAYRKFCEARRVTPLTATHWSQIPAMPTAAFKEFALTSLSAAERTHIFHSSGTTGQSPSRHFHGAESLAVYEASLLAGFRLLFPKWDELLILTPPPGQARHSSLVHMFEVVRREFGAAESAFVGNVADDGAWTLDLDRTLTRLEQSSRTATPFLLLGTAFSFVHLLDKLAERALRFQFPPGSRVLETGGYKGRSRTVPKAELHALLTQRLGVPSSEIISEYGMSELSSQAYDNETERRSPPRRVGARQSDRAGSETGAPSASRLTPHASRSFHFPPWACVQVVSPETGREVADGETGLIRVLDLANVFSVMAIQTEDWGIRRGAGFELLGRAMFSEPRGCSLMTA